MTVDVRQSLSYAMERLIELEEDVDDEELEEEINRAVSDIKTAVNSLDFTAGRQASEEKADQVIENIHDCLIECSDYWEENPEKREMVSDEVLPSIEMVVEELSDTGYDEYRQELDSRWDVDLMGEEDRDYL